MRPQFLLTVMVLTAGCEAGVGTTGSGALADTLVYEPTWEVAPGSHPDADSLGDVTGVAVDGEGNVYVSDRLGSRIWAFDESGVLLQGIGGKGEGPGEFDVPTGIAVSPDGRLYVRDTRRVTVLGPDSISAF